MNTQSTLMAIPEIQNVYTDGFLLDENGMVSFLSLIGKDTAIQEFRARWSIPVTQGGMTDFQVETPTGTARLSLGNPERLEFYSGRLSTDIFGELVQVFVFKKLVQNPDLVNREAMQLLKGDNVNDTESLWTLVKNLSPLPLLDNWQTLILDLFKEKGWIKKLTGSGISAHSINIPEDDLAQLLMANIQSGALLALPTSKGEFIDSSKVVQQPSEALTNLRDELEGTVVELESKAKKEQSLVSELFGEPISIYTRQQAIDDGFLVDVSHTSEAKESGFLVPVCLTSAVWESYVEWPEDVSGQDEKGRLWDVLFMAHFAIKQSQNSGEQLLYKLFCVPKNDPSLTPKEVELKLVSGPGDNGEHVITIMKPNES